jgi:hypothetical protein
MINKMTKSIKMINKMTKINKNDLKSAKMTIFVLISRHGSTAVLILIVDVIQ